MDSWSRPSKHQATPPPLYLIPGGETTPYCKSCGRVIGICSIKINSSKDCLIILGSRKSHSGAEVKYCSTKCRSRKPGKLDRQVEDTFVSFLNGIQSLESPVQAASSLPPKGKGAKKVKGDPRILVPLVAVETAVFGDRNDPEKTFGRKKDRARRGVPDDEEWKSIDMVDELEISLAKEDKMIDGDLLAQMSIRSGTRIRPSQKVSEVNGGVGGEKGRAERVEETEEMLEKRKEGLQRTHEREIVRCAARRGIAFGFVVQGEDEGEREHRKCEAVMQGKVVESSFAKGDWSIRWRE